MFANGGTDDSPVGDAIMEAACLLAGDSKDGARANARGGGLFTFTLGTQRIQCIWKTDEGAITTTTSTSVSAPREPAGMTHPP
jgi:hypothetical protein